MEAGVVDGGAVAAEHGNGVRRRAAEGPLEACHLVWRRRDYAKQRYDGFRERTTPSVPNARTTAVSVSLTRSPKPTDSTRCAFRGRAQPSPAHETRSARPAVAGSPGPHTATSPIRTSPPVHQSPPRFHPPTDRVFSPSRPAPSDPASHPEHPFPTVTRDRLGPRVSCRPRPPARSPLSPATI